MISNKLKNIFQQRIIINKLKNFFLSKKIKYWFLKTVQMQILLTLMALPICVAWGLPISIVSIFGNIIFTPILVLFLLLCSLIFFLELLFIPNGFLIICLEKLSEVWVNLLSYGSLEWLITFPTPSYLLLLTIPITTIGIIQHKKINTIHRRIISFTIVLITFGIIFKSQKIDTSTTKTINFGNKYLNVIEKSGEINIYDYGLFSRSPSPNSWIEYNFIPEIIRSYGHLKINEIVLHNLNKRILIALKLLLKRISCKTIVLSSNKNFKKELYDELLLIASSEKISIKIENNYEINH